MTRKQQIEKEIEAAMSSLDGLAPASPQPFFYTRVTARLIKDENNVWSSLSRMITRPVIAGISVVIIVGVNILAIMHHIPKPATGLPDQAEIAVADEYNRTNSLYSIDNVQP